MNNLVLSENEFHKQLHHAWDSGRTIVPIVGAGASADSGFPPLASVVRYLAKLECFLKNRYFLPAALYDSTKTSPDLPPGARAKVADFAEHMDRYVAIFGWPDRFQLNADLRNKLHHHWPFSEHATQQIQKRGRMDFALSKILDELAGKMNPGGSWTLNAYLEEVAKCQMAMAQAKDKLSAFKKRLKPLLKKIPAELLNELDVAYELLRPEQLDEPTNKINSFRYQVVGDWKPLLRLLSGYQPELVDALFSSLARNRRPGTVHITLAHLVQLLRIRTVFTFNFDPFIENTLAKENVGHRVFAMEHGMELPSKHHIEDTVAVIKMHGSTHNVLVDERVDYRVSERYREQFRDLVGRDPLFLVIGCSGNDRRLVDLIGRVMSDTRFSDQKTIWVHHKSGDSGPESLHGKIMRFGTFDLGQSLQRLFESLTDRLPTSTAPYVAHINRPIISAGNLRGKPKYAVFSHAVSKFLPAQYRSDNLPLTSRAFMHALAEVPLGYTRISVDLEEHHSLEQLVAEIIDQIRSGDSSIPAFVTSGGKLSENNKDYAERAAERVVFALRRSRYVLSISGIDSFPFRATTHHGLTRPPKAGAADPLIDRFELLFDFISHLAKLLQENQWSPGDSVLVLHHEVPYPRHRGNQQERVTVNRISQILNKRLGCIEGVEHKPTHNRNSAKRETQSLDDKEVLHLPQCFAHLKDNSDVPVAVQPHLKAITDFDWRVAIAAIVFHRRTRPKAGLVQLLRELFGSHVGESIVAVLKVPNLLPPWMCWTEEGGMWCDRPARDWVYDRNTRWTALDKLATQRNRSNAIVQALLAAVLHDRIARNYYLNQYLPSRDTFLFLEYVYHRTSTLRYLCQVQLLFATPNLCQLIKETSKVDVGNGESFIDAFEKLAKTTDDRMSHHSTTGDDSTLVATEWSNLVNCLKNAAKSCQPKQRTQLEASLAELRIRCFRGLHQTWARSESYLRRVLPPGQIIEWCENLLAYNLDAKSITNKAQRDRIAIHTTADEQICSVYSKKERQLPEGKSQIASLVRREKQLMHERDALVESIRNTLFRAMYAHSNFRTIVQDDWLCGVDRISFGESATNIHWQLNRIVAKLWDDQSSTAFAPANYQNLNSRIDAALQAERKGAEYAETRLRMYYIKAEVALATFNYQRSVPRTNAQAGTPWTPKDESEFDWWKQFWAATQNRLHAAIEEAREEYPTSIGLMQNPLLEPTADRGLFIPYKSLFQIQLGRSRLCEAQLYSATARSAVRFPKQFPISTKHEMELIQNAKDALKCAYKDLAYAKNGIGAENSILLAIADLCSADVAIAGSELAWGEHYRATDWRDGKNSLKQSLAKLQTASGYLTRCLERLLDGPRYVLVWRFFHWSQAEYHISRILSIIDEVTVMRSLNEPLESDYLTKRCGELVRRTRLCLTGIRFGLDYSPAGRADAFRSKFQKLWLELCATSLSAAMILSKSSRASAVSLLDLFVSAWVDINMSEDMFCQSEGKLIAQDVSSRFREWVHEPLAVVCQKWDSVDKVSKLIELRDYTRETFSQSIHDCMLRDNGKPAIMLR